MKPLATLLILLLLYCTPMLGQDSDPIQYGIKAGINYNELKGKNFESAYQSDWHLGGYLHLRGEKLGLGIEAIYDKGRYEMRNLVLDAAQYHLIGDTSSSNAMLQVQKFQIPLYLMYKISVFHLMLGAVYEMNLHMKDSEEMITDFKSGFENNYPSLMGGIWLDLTSKLNIGARYQMGIEDVNTAAWNSEWRSREIQIHVGLRI